MRRVLSCLLFVVAVISAGLVESAASPSSPASAQYAMPSSKHEVRLQRSAQVPMRDGVRLSTDLYFPEGAGDKLPTVLIRTPYDKNAYRRRTDSVASLFAGRGHVVAVQDKRGRYESEGRFLVYGGDAEDGYDTVDWLAAQPWSNGRVGTYGCSSPGDYQMFQATLRNPHHAAMIPQATGGAVGSAGGRYRYFGLINGGAVELALGFGWFRGSGNKIYYAPPPEMDRGEWLASDDAQYFDPAPDLPDIDHAEIWPSLPIADMMSKGRTPPTDWQRVVSTPLTDPWWDQFHYLTDEDHFDVPALFINSWYDYGVAETLYEFNLLQRNSETARARDSQFVIISPTTHCGSERTTEHTVVGERDLGDPRKDFWRIYVDWFDHWLGGADNGITSMPKVQYYLMGKNEWRSASRWPLPDTQFDRYYLHSDGRANSRFGTGTLSNAMPGDEPPDRFTYDPGTPVPSRGGNFCCSGTPDAQGGSFDQREVETRQDVLVYTTLPLDEGVEVTGPIEATLYVSSSARDTDFIVKLVDVYPDGTAYNVQEGILRARYREGFDRKVWMRPDEIYPVRVDMHATSNYFGPGHRIRVEVSSSSFPRFDRNLNTGGNNFDETEWVVAHNTIHHAGEHSSYVVLPIVQ